MVTVRGELDIGSAPVLREALLRLIAEDAVPDVVVDGSAVTFVDSSGLAVLLMAARRWSASGKQLVLRKPSRSLWRIVEMTGAAGAFAYDDR